MPDIVSESFPYAMILPVNVSPPMRTVRNIAPRNAGLSKTPETYSAEPTKRLAIPPKPLKIATISGIEVIFTLVAAKKPTILPATKAPAIYR